MAVAVLVVLGAAGEAPGEDAEDVYAAESERELERTVENEPEPEQERDEQQSTGDLAPAWSKDGRSSDVSRVSAVARSLPAGIADEPFRPPIRAHG